LIFLSRPNVFTSGKLGDVVPGQRHPLDYVTSGNLYLNIEKNNISELSTISSKFKLLSLWIFRKDYSSLWEL